MSSIRIAGIVKESVVDGPGLRLVVFTQGCPHRCPGCHNPHTHPFEGGYDCQTEELLAELDKNPLLRGVTLSGGEPFARAGELLLLSREVRRRGKDLWLYSGYTFEQLWEQAQGDPAVRELLELGAVLVDGPYMQERRDQTLPFRGSGNQRILNLPESLAQGRAVPVQ